MKDDQGNITSIGLVLLLSIVSIGSITLIQKTNDIKRHKITFENFLCVKEALGLIANHKQTIEVTNNIIRLANLGQVVGIFATPTATLTAKKAKQLTQRSQDIYHISFVKNISALFSKSCIFSSGVVKTHFKTKSVIKLERNSSGTVNKRRGRWEFSSLNDSSQIKSSINSKSIKTKTSFY